MVRHSLSRRQILHRSVAAGALLCVPGSLLAAETGPPPLSAYARLPAIDRAVISPDGKRAACVVNDGTGGLAIEETDLDSGKRAAVTVEEANSVPVLIWASNDSVFYATSHTEGGMGMRYETWTGYLRDIRSGRRYRIYAELEEYKRNLVGDIHRIRRDGAYYVTASNYRVTAANYVVDYLTTLYAFSFKHAAINIDHDSRPIVAWALTGDGRALARSEYDKDTREWRLRYFGSDGWRVIYSETGGEELPVLKGPGRDGRSVLLYFRDGRFADSYVELRPDGSFSEALASNRAVLTPVFHPADGRLIGFASIYGAGKGIAYDEAYAATANAAEALAPGDLTDISDLGEDLRQFVLYSEGPGNPGTYEAVDRISGARTVLGSTYPEVPPAWLSVKSRVSYAASDGLAIEAMLSLPPGSRAPYPTVVLVHGGPESYDDLRFDWMAQALTSRGYAVFQPNYRGSSGYGRAFVEKGYGEWGRRMQTDISDGVAWLAAQGIADAQRVAIAGASYGGYAALAGLALQPGIYRCGVAMSGISDLRAYMDQVLRAAQLNPGQAAYRYWSRFVGPEDGWDAVSPLRHAADITAPLMLIHGRKDTVVDFEQSDRMREALVQAGKPVEMVLLSDEDHYLSKASTRLQALEAMVAFVLKHNPPF